MFALLESCSDFDLGFVTGPQLAFTVYGMSSWGSETVIGYGRTHLPTTHGVRYKKVALFAPRATTPFGNIMSWLTGKSPELIDPTIICDGNDNYCKFFCCLNLQYYSVEVKNKIYLAHKTINLFSKYLIFVFFFQ